jgi:hypothetical protein
MKGGKKIYTRSGKKKWYIFRLKGRRVMHNWQGFELTDSFVFGR